MGALLGVVGGIGTVIKLVAKPLVGLANKVPQGKLTGTGGIIGAIGLATGLISPHVVTDQNIIGILNAVAGILTALGTIVASFGAQRAHVA